MPLLLRYTSVVSLSGLLFVLNSSRHCPDTLNDENFVIFLRRYWFSDTYAEISERTGIPKKSVSMRLVRIRKQLKQYLIEREVYV